MRRDQLETLARVQMLRDVLRRHAVGAASHVAPAREAPAVKGLAYAPLARPCASRGWHWLWLVGFELSAFGIEHPHDFIEIVRGGFGFHAPGARVGRIDVYEHVRIQHIDQVLLQMHVQAARAHRAQLTTEAHSDASRRLLPFRLCAEGTTPPLLLHLVLDLCGRVGVGVDGAPLAESLRHEVHLLRLA